MKKKYLKKIIPAVALLIISIVAILVISLNNDDKPTQYEELTGFYFDTYISVRLYYNEDDYYNNHAEYEGVTPTEYFNEALTYIEDICKTYHELTNRYNETSDIAKVNANGRSAVDSYTYGIIKSSLQYSELTSGAFDITLGTVTKGFSAVDKTIYDNETTNELLKDINYKNVDLFSKNSGTNFYREVTLLGENTSIDLGGIVKGYVADEITSYLKKKGIFNALINLGGNIVTMSGKNTTKDYIIGIQKPFAATGENIAIIKIKPNLYDNVHSTSIVTSGIYERYFEKDGKLYHHIFDPATGYPVDNDLYSVTIISDNSTLADCLSTALFVMGIEEGLALVNTLENTECIFIDKNNSFTYSDGLIFDNNTFSLK